MKGSERKCVGWGGRGGLQVHVFLLNVLSRTAAFVSSEIKSIYIKLDNIVGFLLNMSYSFIS